MITDASLVLVVYFQLNTFSCPSALVHYQTCENCEISVTQNASESMIMAKIKRGRNAKY